MSLYDLSTSEEIQTIEKAHGASIWSLCMHLNPVGYNGITIISGSADKHIKFWQLVVNKKTKLIEISEIKKIYVNEDVHCVKFSPKGQYYAVSLLDYSINIYYSDSDKLYLSLYGHKLPALSFDISSDDNLLVSGSADKNIKIWGTDFGNCHKSIFAHDNSIMQIRFVVDTHYFFSISKDNSIKYWDGDTY